MLARDTSSPPASLSPNTSFLTFRLVRSCAYNSKVYSGELSVHDKLSLSSVNFLELEGCVKSFYFTIGIMIEDSKIQQAKLILP